MSKLHLCLIMVLVLCSQLVAQSVPPDASSLDDSRLDQAAEAMTQRHFDDALVKLREVAADTGASPASAAMAQSGNPTRRTSKERLQPNRNPTLILETITGIIA